MLQDHENKITNEVRVFNNFIFVCISSVCLFFPFKLTLKLLISDLIKLIVPMIIVMIYYNYHD